MSSYCSPEMAKSLAQERIDNAKALQLIEKNLGITGRLYTPNCNDGGIDAILDCVCCPMSADIKNLKTAYYSDIPLEYEDRGKPGWIMADDKGTDVYIFHRKPTEEIIILPAMRLRKAARLHRNEWLNLNPNQTQKTLERWQTLVAYVPLATILLAIEPDALNRLGG